MNLETIERLEKLVDRLLAKNRELQEEKALLLKERERYCREVDRILGKLEHLDREAG